MPSTRSGWVTLVAALYLISGALNLLVGLAALGVTLSGSSTVDTVTLGDWPTDDLEGAAVVVIAFAVLQLALGAGILGRSRWAWTVGLIVSCLVIVTHIFSILAAKEAEFGPSGERSAAWAAGPPALDDLVARRELRLQLAAGAGLDLVPG